jgi:hypothetical protein
MVLLDQRIEVVDLPQVHAFSKQPGGFEVSHDLGVGRMLVDMITRGTNVVVEQCRVIVTIENSSF